jgi:hypothetical protein
MNYAYQTKMKRSRAHTIAVLKNEIKTQARNYVIL